MDLTLHVEHLLRIARDAGIRRLNGATAAEIQDLEALLGRLLPEELKTWLAACRGVHVGVYALLGVDERHGARSIRTVMSKEWWNREWIPVATDGCGNFYCLVPDPGAPSGYGVGFVESLSPEKVQYAVASSLERFLHFYLAEVEQTMLDEDDSEEDGEEEDEELDVDELGLPVSSGWPFEKELVLQDDPQIERLTFMPKPWNVADCSD